MVDPSSYRGYIFWGDGSGPSGRCYSITSIFSNMTNLFLVTSLLYFIDSYIQFVDIWQSLPLILE